jgi:cephalosporin hydroxylase
MGAKALKNPLDSWIYQEILYEVKPDVIIELGSAAGGSTLFFAHLLQIMGKGVVVSIDVDRSRYTIGDHDNIVPITGHSASPEVIERVSEICEGNNAIVFHDADHRKASVLRDLENYARFVQVGSYIIVEDGIVDLFRPTDGFEFFEEGPLPAVEEFVKRNSDFVIDSTRERYIATYNPKGFLKRIR